MSVLLHPQDRLSGAQVAPEDDPFEWLAQCHRRVEHFTQLVLRLHDHLQARGWDRSAQEAAHDVIRYFEQAAPLHHADEEDDLFPWLKAHGGDADQQALTALEEDHRRLDEQWQALRADLQAGATLEVLATSLEARSGRSGLLGDRTALEHWYAAYARHIAVEEGQIYPALRQVMDAEARHRALRKMRARRGWPES